MSHKREAKESPHQIFALSGNIEGVSGGSNVVARGDTFGD